MMDRVTKALIIKLSCLIVNFDNTITKLNLVAHVTLQIVFNSRYTNFIISLFFLLFRFPSQILQPLLVTQLLSYTVTWNQSKPQYLLLQGITILVLSTYFQVCDQIKFDPFCLHCSCFPLTGHVFCMLRDLSRGSNSDAGKMDQTPWIKLDLVCD